MNYMRIQLITAFCIVLTLAMSGCAGRTKAGQSKLGYTATAQHLFEEAMFGFERERWADAEKVFQEVRRQYPYSKYASLAELRMADCQFNLGSHAEAAVAYQHFLKVHPTHEEAHYAAFKRGEAYYEQIPGDFVITPPPHEKDQSATRDARAALAHFLRAYPDSEWKELASELYIEVENALVRHEMYVARFYLRRDKRKAAAVRLEGIGKQYEQSPLVPDAMFLQATTFLEMNEIKEARRIFSDIINMFPKHNQALRAKAYLEAL